VLESKKDDGQNLSVGKLLEIIASREEEDWGHAYSSVEPTKFNDDYQSHPLDCLARLMTSNETCIAVCEIDGKLLVASNQSSPSYAKEYIPKLQVYLNDPKNDTYEPLESEARDQISKKIIGNRRYGQFKNSYDFLKRMPPTNALYNSMDAYHQNRTKENLDQVISKCGAILALPEGTVNEKVYRTYQILCAH